MSDKDPSLLAYPNERRCTCNFSVDFQHRRKKRENNFHFILFLIFQSALKVTLLYSVISSELQYSFTYTPFQFVLKSRDFSRSVNLNMLTVFALVLFTNFLP